MKPDKELGENRWELQPTWPTISLERAMGVSALPTDESEPPTRRSNADFLESMLFRSVIAKPVASPNELRALLNLLHKEGVDGEAAYQKALAHRVAFLRGNRTRSTPPTFEELNWSPSGETQQTPPPHTPL